MRSLISLVICFNFIHAEAQQKLNTDQPSNVKFLNTTVSFERFKAHQECVGLILFINNTKHNLTVREINNECSCITSIAKQKVVGPGNKGIIEYSIKDPLPGEIQKKSFIFFNEIPKPVRVIVKGNFL